MNAPLDPNKTVEGKGVSLIAITNGDRRSIGDAIETLIAMLDQLEPDPDLEEGGDLEASLGWPNWLGPSQLSHSIAPDDREEDSYDAEDGSDDEPSLGSSRDYAGSANQTRWSEGCATRARADECEDENEHGGDVCDEPHDWDELEPNLGWAETWGQGPKVAIDISPAS